MTPRRHALSRRRLPAAVAALAVAFVGVGAVTTASSASPLPSLRSSLTSAATADRPGAEQPGTEHRAAEQAPVVSVPADAPVSFAQTALTKATPPPRAGAASSGPATVAPSPRGGTAAGPTKVTPSPRGGAATSGWPSTQSLRETASELGLDPGHFVLADKGSWGVADWYHDTVYIAPRTPAGKLRSVLLHEQAHLDHAHTYGGDIAALTRDANRVFGGAGLGGAERAADCMALLRGATWTNYTGCSAATQQDAARRLSAGQQL